MRSLIFKSVSLTVLLLILCCGIYPLAVTLVGQGLFPDKAAGSFVKVDGKVVGSRLIGQTFSAPQYFQGRPSAAGEKGYDASASSGSNLGPTNKKLADRMKNDIDALLKANPNLQKSAIPPDLVTTSASGLDPHISPEAASVQIDRVAKSRGLNSSQVAALVDKYTEGPQLGLLGEPVVNVLLLNLALDGHEQL